MDGQRRPVVPTVATAVGLADVASRHWRMPFARNVGRREAGRVVAPAYGLLFIAAFWAYEESMAVVFGLAVLLEVYHRVYPGEGVTSNYIGDCVLGDWRWVGGLGIALGWLVFEDVPPLGAWLFLSGAGTLLTVTAARMRVRYLDDMTRDGLLEQRYRAVRLRGGVR